MKTDIGEYIVGSYLSLIEKCDFVSYNIRPPEAGLRGLAEFDVIGLDLKKHIAYLCEVTTHTRGVLYGTNKKTFKKILEKYQRQKQYAGKYLNDFPTRHFMFWSPVVPNGYLTKKLRGVKGLGLVINKEYAERIRKIRRLAKSITRDTGNPFFRMLQILESIDEN